MKAYIILGNTRQNSNTKALSLALGNELHAMGIDVKTVSLNELDIRTCVGCDKCHSVLDSFGCVINDDMEEVANEILLSDLVIWTSPIYSWMPTPPLKAAMDRSYAFTKYPENADAFNLLIKQKFAMVATSGDDPKTNCDLFDESLRRMATFAKLHYIGYLAAQDKGDGNIVTETVLNDVKAFAVKCIDALQK